jgi:hypothetical protein
MVPRIVATLRSDTIRCAVNCPVTSILPNANPLGGSIVLVDGTMVPIWD